MKIKAVMPNFWDVFEVPVMNFDCSDTLLSIMQLQIRSKGMFYFQPTHKMPILVKKKI